MKTLYKFIPVLVLCLTFSFCTKEDEVPIDIEVHDFVWKAMNAYYLDQDLIPALSDTRFSSHPELNNYLRQYESPNELLASILFHNPDSDTKTHLINDYNLLEQPVNRTSVTHGVEYGIIADPGSTDNVLGYIQYILPNSNATTKNLKRGEFFYKVDNTQLTRENFRTLLEGSSTYELTMATFDGVKVEEDSIIVNTVKVPKKISLEKSGYTHNPIFISKTIVSGTNTIGYLMYNNDFSSNYLNDLNNTISQFNSQNVNQLVLDLRYNIGGGSITENIVKLGSMITGQFLDQPFLKERWNVKAQPWFEMHQPDSIVTKFTNKLNNSTQINSLGLTDVYIILNGSSSSIELLINSLRSHINVHIINSNTTDGNSTGSITLYNSIDYDSIGASPNHSVALKPIVLDFLNNDDETYNEGFTPNLRICNQEDILNLGELGELSDPILNEVINYVNGSIPTPPTMCNPNNFEYLFNSVRRQRLIDTGVFIKRDLPNTN
jgi:hypothetical protein